jgi:hypothetical protein
MADIANVSINDATPTAVVFGPRRRGPENSLHVKSAYVAANDFVSADCNLTLGVSPATVKRPTNHVNVGLSFPDPDYLITNEDPIDVARWQIKAIIPDSFTLANRQHFMALGANLMANAVISDAVEDGEGAY